MNKLQTGLLNVHNCSVPYLFFFFSEIAYFNPSSKDVIPGVTPQILRIKVRISLL